MSIKSVGKYMTRVLSDRTYIRLKYFSRFHRFPNLKNPKTFNEKMQWLKLNDRDPLYTKMVDKYEAKEYVAGIIGSEYIIPALGVWDRYEDIDFSMLPERFVLKCTHNSGGLFICKDKSDIDRKEVKRMFDRCLKSNYYYHGREWPYKNVKPRILAEEYLEDSKTGELRDYKIFCFNGTPKLMYVASERYNKASETRFDFYDMNFKHLDIRNTHPHADIIPERPAHFDEMKALAAKLSKGFPLLRVDFYEVDGKVYFGELTFFHMNGFMPFEPPEWDEKIGSWLELPER